MRTPSAAMPVPLPPPPTGPTQLPLPPQDPPTLVDISNAVAYNKQILVNYGMFSPHFHRLRSHLFSEAGVATKNGVARAVVYQAAVTAQNAGGGMLFIANHR